MRLSISGEIPKYDALLFCGKRSTKFGYDLTNSSYRSSAVKLMAACILF